jgi:hypothetical protein
MKKELLGHAYGDFISDRELFQEVKREASIIFNVPEEDIAFQLSDDIKDTLCMEWDVWRIR